MSAGPRSHHCYFAIIGSTGSRQIYIKKSTLSSQHNRLLSTITETPTWLRRRISKKSSKSALKFFAGPLKDTYDEALKNRVFLGVVGFIFSLRHIWQLIKSTIMFVTKEKTHLVLKPSSIVLYHQHTTLHLQRDTTTIMYTSSITQLTKNTKLQ